MTRVYVNSVGRLFIALLFSFAGITIVSAAIHSADSSAFSIDLRTSVATIPKIAVSPSNPVAGQQVTLSVNFTPGSGETVKKVEYYLLNELIDTAYSGGPSFPIVYRPRLPVYHVIIAKVYVEGNTTPYVSDWKNDKGFFRPRAIIDDIGLDSSVLKEHNKIGNRGKPARRNTVNGNPTGGFLLQVPRVRTPLSPNGEVPIQSDFNYPSSLTKWAVVASGPQMGNLPTPLVLPLSAIMTGTSGPAALNIQKDPELDYYGTRDPDIQLPPTNDDKPPRYNGYFVIANPANLGEFAAEFHPETKLAVYRVTDFQGMLLEKGQNPVSVSVLKDRVIIMVHGWQPDGPSNPFAVDEMKQLTKKLIEETENTQWSVAGYNWTDDAATGSRPLGLVLENSLNRNESLPVHPFAAGVATPGIKAAEIGYQHGATLGKKLWEGKGNRLKSVHFIAHSAGSWVAYAASKHLRNSGYNGDLMVTLLDPYMPAQSGFLPNDVGLQSTLGVTTMKGLGSLIPALRLNNIFAHDSTGGGTENMFFLPWFETEIKRDDSWILYALPIISNEPLGKIKDISWWAFGHGQPIRWYADSILFAKTGVVAWSDPDKYRSYGWLQSAFVRSLPGIETPGEILVLVPQTGTITNWQYQLKALNGANNFKLIDGDGARWLSVSTTGLLSGVPTLESRIYNIVLSISNEVAERRVGIRIKVTSSPTTSYSVSLTPGSDVTQKVSPGASVTIDCGLPAKAKGDPSKVKIYYVASKGTTSQSVFMDGGRMVAAASGERVLVGTGLTFELKNITAANAGTYYAEAIVDGITYRSAELVLTVDSTTPITLGSASANFTAGGGPGSVGITAGSPWTATANASWITIIGGGSGSGNGTVSYVVSANNGEARTGTISIGGQTHTVTQAAKEIVTGPTSRLANLSVRAPMAANQTLIVGMVVSGGPRDILVRAVGPTLANYGLSGAMADPRLELYNGSTKVHSNDNWPSSLAGTFATLSAFPLPNGSSDAAFVQSMDGPRSIWVQGTGAGIVLMEAYDIGTSNSPRLVNVSARNKVGTGDDILIAGFTIVGTGNKQLLIRAVGPALTSFGVSGVLADPKLEVYKGSTKLVENDNWATSLSATFASVSAFPLTSGSKDAALVTSLAPGTYTVQVKGADGGIGEALIEIYELPDPPVTKPNVSQEMVRIPGGTFTMGDSKGDGLTNERPTHTVTVSTFYLWKTEVTYGQWKEVYDWNESGRRGYDFAMGQRGSTSSDAELLDTLENNTHPVTMVNWYDVVAWCNAKSRKDGFDPCYYTDAAFTTEIKSGSPTVFVKWTANGYRLPTEAEWEYAARGGLAGKSYPWGDGLTGSQANYYGSGDPFGGTTPVGYYNGGQTPAGADMKNGYGLYDMSGNVWEWCWDWYGSYSSNDTISPQGPTSGRYRVLRGGDWKDPVSGVRVAFRHFDLPNYPYGNRGFRPAQFLP